MRSNSSIQFQLSF